MRIHLVPNSHIDPVWLWDKYEGIDEVLATFRSACDRLEEYPELTFSASSLQFYEWVLEYDRPLFERIKKNIAAGRWEIVGGWWVESDSNLPSEASMRKQAKLSKAFSLKHFGVSSDVAYLPDTFGHPATLPMILSETGFKYFIFCRPGAHENSDLPSNLFWWEYKGCKVLAYRLKHHYNQWVPENEHTGKLREILKDEEYSRSAVNCFLFGVGDHGGGPTIAQIESFNRLIKERPSDLAYSTCKRFFDEAAEIPDIPAYSGNLHMHAVGCYSIMRNIKQGVRGSEQQLAYAARSLKLAGKSSRCLDPLWKTTLFNQFHDILPGSCAPHAAQFACDELGGVAAECRNSAYGALKSVSGRTPSKVKEGEFRIFNTLPFDITCPLKIEAFSGYRPELQFRDSAGKTIRIQKVLESVRCGNSRWEFVDTIPARSFKAYHFDTSSPIEPAPGEAAHFHAGTSITNESFTINADGTVISANGSQLLKSPPKFVALNDESDTWGHGVRCYNKPTGGFNLASSTVMTGSVTQKLYQRWNFNNSSIDIVWSLFAGIPQIFADITVDWAEQRTILKMELDPSGAGSQDYLVQAAGGSIECKADGAEMPMHGWLRIPVGKEQLAVVQDGAFAYDCLNGRLRLTLVRSSLYGYDIGCKLFPEDTQQHTDQGIHKFRLCLLPGRNFKEKELDQAALAFVEPLMVIRETR